MKRSFKSPLPYWSGSGEKTERRRLLFNRWKAAPDHLLVPGAPFMDTLAALSPKMMKDSKMEKGETATRVVKEDVGELTVFNVDDVAEDLGIFAHKLLSVFANYFVSVEHARSGDDLPVKDLQLTLPVWDTAEIFGLDLEPRYPLAESGELDARDQARVAPMLKDFRARVKDALNALWHVEVPIKMFLTTERGGKKRSSLMRGKSRVITNMGEVGGDCITLQISPDMAKYLSALPLRQVPTPLMQIDNRLRLPYSLIWKMATHYSRASNHAPGKTPNRLRVKTLLLASPLPLADAAYLRHYGWRTRLLEPFQRAMESLKGEWIKKRDEETKPFRESPAEDGAGLLEWWDYVGPGGAKLTDEQKDFQTLEAWLDARVEFRLRTPPKVDPPKLRKRGRKKASAEPAEGAEKPVSEPPGQNLSL